MLAIETIPLVAEAVAIASLLKEAFSDTYAWISFSAKDGEHISSGEQIAEAAEKLNAFNQIAAVGVNCTAPEWIPSLIQKIKSVTHKPVVVYPNLGETYDAKTKTWSGAPDKQAYSKHTQYWRNCGARLIGGCCRTKPADIETIASWAKTTE